MNVEQIAKLTHNVLARYSKAFLDTDFQSVTEWDSLPQERREMEINDILMHLQYSVTPEEAHATWLDKKLEEGWTFSEDFSSEDKESPFIVEYNELPLEQRVRDELHKIIIDSCREIMEAANGIETKEREQERQDALDQIKLDASMEILRLGLNSGIDGATFVAAQGQYLQFISKK